MAKWILKAVIQKTISFLPYKEELNFFFQRYVTRGVALTDYHFECKLAAARDHVAYYHKYGTTPTSSAKALELGTGWYPIVPAMLFLAGFERTVSVDIRDWLTRDRQLIALQKILDYHDSGRLASYLPNIEADRLAVLRDTCAAPEQLTRGEINERIRLDTRVMDATRLTFPDDTFDFVCSNNTFEHVYPDVLASILAEFKRVVKPTGVMSHFVDLTDHFAHLDASIDIYHFLRFSRRQWSLIDNDIQPQNRLRWPDYLAMYHRLGIAIREESTTPGHEELIHDRRLHADYLDYSPEDLAISHGYIIS